MYQPSTACVDKEGRVEFYLWTKILVSGGKGGVALNSNFPLMTVWEEKFRFMREDRSRLRVIMAWGMR